MKKYLVLLIILAISCESKNENSTALKLKESAAIPKESHAIIPGYVNLRKSKNMEDILCQCWENTTDLDDSKFYPNPDGEIVLRGYCFYNDGTVVKDSRGYMEQGRWKLNHQSKPITLNLLFNTGNDESAAIALITPTRLTLADENKELHEYTGTGLKQINERDDPFHPVNNKWRVRPAIPETAAQIRSRVEGCVHFFVLFYEYMINTKSESVLFAGFPSCFTWYAGGIYMQPLDKLQKKWIDCFYDRKQAMQAYALAGNLVQQKYTWPKEEKNWMKLNLSVLKQMEKRIDSVN